MSAPTCNAERHRYTGHGAERPLQAPLGIARRHVLQAGDQPEHALSPIAPCHCKPRTER